MNPTTAEPQAGSGAIEVNNFYSIGIIFRANNPREIFTDIKWQYPVKAFNNMACPQGGNWFNEDAKGDGGPRGTLCRELGEELSFDKAADQDELAKILDITLPPREEFPANRNASDIDREILAELSLVFQELAAPFTDFYTFTPKSILDAADPENQRGDMSAVVSAWSIPLVEKDWRRLWELQTKFGNLSNESRSIIISISQMIKANTHTAFGHDRILQAFWRAMGIAGAKDLPLVEGIEHRLVGTPRASWLDYLPDFNPKRRPPGF